MAEDVVNVLFDTVMYMINREMEAFVLDELVQSAVVEVEELRGVLEFLDEPEDQLSQTENEHQMSGHEGWTLQARRLVDEIDNLSETIKKKIDEISRYHWKRVMTLLECQRMGKELSRLMREIQVFSKVARLYFAIFSTSSATRWGEPDSSSVKNRTPKCADVYDALGNLEFALRKAYVSVHHKHYKEITSIKAQLLPMLDLLNDIKPTQKIDNSQRVWMQILEDSFQSIGNKFKSLVELTDTGTIIGEKLTKLKKMDSEEIMEFISWQEAKEFCSFILHKRNEIFKVWNRYHTYRIQEFEGLDGSRLVVDPDLSLHVGGKMNNHWDSFLYHFIQSLKTIPMVEDAPKEMELKFDLKLMKALTKDAELGDQDEREKIWVKQMEDILQEMEIVNQQFQTSKSGNIRKQYMNFKLRKRVQRLEEMLNQISMRTRFYCIGSPGLRYGSTNSYNLFPESWKIEDKIESVKRELQLMEGLFQDVKRIGQLDARLKVWLQEMHCVAREAKGIIEQISKGSSTRVALTKIHWIGKRICDISEWSLNYGIEGVRARKGSSSLAEELEETSPYPKDSVEEQVDLIKREVKMLQALDMDIEKMDRFNCGSLQAWVQELREVSVEAESLISTFFNKKQQILKKRNLVAQIKYKISQAEHTSESNQVYTRSQVVTNVTQMKDKIQKLHQRRRGYGIQYFDRKYSNIADELRARLLAYDDNNFRIIPILSAWDKDKVFLREFIDEDDSIASHFSLRIWLTLNQEENAVLLLENMYMKVMAQQNSKNIVSSKEINGSAGEEMINNRCLVVVDEIQNSVIWNLLMKLWESTSRGSRIIFSTCHAEANCAGLYTTDTNQLSAGVDSPVLLPLRMRVLQPQINTTQLGMVLIEHDGVSQMADLSVESIPSYLRECLYYFMLFPSKDSNGSDIYIPIRRLIGIWVADGIVRRRRAAKEVPIELIAEGYLSELIKLGIIQVKEKNGKIRKCRFNDDEQLQESCLMKAKEYDFFQSESSSQKQNEYFGDTMGNIYRLTDLPADDNSNACNRHIHNLDNHSVSLSSYYRNVRSFLSFDIQERSKPGEDIGNFLEKAISKRCFLTLRVLDLEHIFRPNLPKGLSKLIRLRYLGLRWTYLESLQSSVSDLLNLQVLDVKHTYISKLPKSIWRMQYLRHLYLSDTYRSRFVGRPQSSESLSNLQTLWGAFVDEDSPVEGGLDTLLNVRKLGLICRSTHDKKKMASQLEAVANWVVSLKDLESLRLKSHDEKGMPSDLYLKPLSGHGNLSVLNVVGILKYPSVISDLPLNLTEVTLSGSELENDPLHSVEYLPRLISLRLLVDASKCRKMGCSSRGFPKLETLHLWKLEMLEELEVEEGGMPLLQHMEIRSCPNMEKLPDRLEHVCKRT